jgi:uncharacterized membrane protein YdjX (TVP38/TMEM64 family)
LSKTFKFLTLVLVLAACWLLGRFFSVEIEQYQTLLSKYPLILSGLIFVVLYVVVTFFVLFGAKDAFRVTAAVFFGSYVSTILVWLAESVNAVVLFTLSRRLGRAFVEERFKLQPQQIDQVKKDTGFLGVFALRINPLIPFRFMDLGFGLSSINFRKYLMVVLTASLPRVLWLQYILAGVGTSIFKDLPAVMEYLTANSFIVLYSMLYFLAVIILTVSAIAVRFLKKKSQASNLK